MQIAVWSSYFYDLPPEEMVKILNTHGWSCCDFSNEHASQLLNRGDPEETGLAFKKFADNLGFTLPQGHLELFADIAQPIDTPEQARAIDSLKKWLDLFTALGIQAAVLHPGGNKLKKEGIEYGMINSCIIDSLHKLLDYIKGRPLAICLENIWLRKQPFDIINTFDNDQLGFCLDTGHLRITMGNHVKFIQKAGKKLLALHISDNLGEQDNHMLPFGAGIIKDWKEIMAALKEVEYNGLFSFELPGECFNCPLDLRIEKLTYVKKVGDYMLTL